MTEEFRETTIDGVQFRYRVRDGWCCWSSDWVRAHDLPQLEVRWAGEGLYRQGEFHLTADHLRHLVLQSEAVLRNLRLERDGDLNHYE